ncbi:MAG TPA: site-specific integrase, partial [Dissulfurispiraceae bacterium]|nr:site-specific integrase [Dissulfurispiraceae bacterium]
VSQGKDIEPAKVIKNYTFNELADEYEKWCERQRSYRSKQGFLSQLRGAFGTLQLRHITTKLIEQFQSERLLKGNKKVKIGVTEWKHLPNTPATVNRLVATLKHCIHKAYQWEMCHEETLKRVRQVKLLPENNKRLRYLSKKECMTLLSHCKDYLKPIVMTALNTGMRKEEILSLKWDNVDMVHGFISLDRTKNGERREIPINETLTVTLKGLVRRIDVPYVFHDVSTGKRFKDIKKPFGTAMKKAGIVDFRFHDLRHTFASHLVMAGVDITTVSKLLGHKSLTMTLRYSHLAPDHLSRAVNVLDITGGNAEETTAQAAGQK